MAILKAEIQFNFEPVAVLFRVFPDLNGRFLSLIGKRGRTILKEELLAGQELNVFGDNPNRPIRSKGKKGKLLITSDVNKRRNAVKIYSFPANLFERGRLLRSGRKEPGKFIITRLLKQDIMSRMSGYVLEFEGKILNPEIKKAGL